MDRVRSSILGTNDQLHLYPHTSPSPLGLLPMELTLPSVKGYPRFLMRSFYGQTRTATAIRPGKAAERHLEAGSQQQCAGRATGGRTNTRVSYETDKGGAGDLGQI